jgi:tetratricopeptide (TPR) repeat protein
MEVAGYSSREVAGLLGLSVGQVRGFVHTGVLSPARGAAGELRFSFQDVVLLRAAKGLRSARIASARIKRALDRLRAQLPPGRPLTGVAIAADGNRIVVRDGGARWNPESGQALFDFTARAPGSRRDAAPDGAEEGSVAELMAKVAPLRDTAALEAEAVAAYERGCALEERDPPAALAAYLRAVELDVNHASAHINLGRLLHEAGRLRDALAHYRLALAARPRGRAAPDGAEEGSARAGDAVATFNLGVALEDLGRTGDAIDAYCATLRADARHADAHFNLARLYERLGRRKSAARHLAAYRQLTE